LKLQNKKRKKIKRYKQTKLFQPYSTIYYKEIFLLAFSKKGFKLNLSNKNNNNNDKQNLILSIKK